MNYCLRNPCHNGYAVWLDGVIKFRYDDFGSYSVVHVLGPKEEDKITAAPSALKLTVEL